MAEYNTTLEYWDGPPSVEDIMNMMNVEFRDNDHRDYVYWMLDNALFQHREKARYEHLNRREEF